MKKRKLLCTAILAMLLIPTATFAACNHDTSPTISQNDSEISAILPDTDSPNGNEQESNNAQGSSPNVSESPNIPTTQNTQYIRCTGDSVRLRSGAGTEYSVLGVAEKGTSYVVLGKSGGWYKTYYRGKVAYISASYVSVFSMAQTDERTEDVLAEGYKLIGVPYVYGAVRLHDGKGNFLKGFTAQKFDCSSLIQYVFYQGAGKVLDVTTRTQVKQGKYVARSALQRGDCIFFTNEERQYKTGVERIGHVAIYLGDDYILHTASDYARIEKMTAKRWSFYVEARRFL